jgi:hypothetical protein
MTLYSHGMASHSRQQKKPARIRPVTFYLNRSEFPRLRYGFATHSPATQGMRCRSMKCVAVYNNLSDIPTGWELNHTANAKIARTIRINTILFFRVISLHQKKTGSN